MEIRENVPLAPLTTFRIGGPARYFVEVSDARELSECLEFAEKSGVPAVVISGGSNIIVADRGYRGVVIRLVDGGRMFRDDGGVEVGAGVPLLSLVEDACRKGMAGIEKLAGIPGSVGGAIRGNAGAFGADIGSVVSSVKALDRGTGSVREFSYAECGFGYRMSLFKRRSELVIVSATLRLRPGADPESLVREMRETIATREAKHPQDVFCAGSFFMNPVVGSEELRRDFESDTGQKPKDDKLPAGWLIDAVGLRGKTIGHAKMSETHPNYLINTGGATAEDVITLASIVKQKVRVELGVQLREEVQFVGFGGKS